MKEVFIADAKRTPIGSYLGALKTISSPKLAKIILEHLININKIDMSDIDEVIIGQVITGGSGQNPARQSLIEAGIPNFVPALTINKVCGSSLASVIAATRSIKLGDSKMIVAGGQENMSLAHHGGYIRNGTKFGEINLIDYMMYDGLTDAFSNVLMGTTAENIARKFNISREEQDQFALNSQSKASFAQKKNLFEKEIIPIKINVKKEEKIISEDEGVRHNSSIEKLSKLKPAFEKDGTVTAGNSSTINDGAAMLLLASEEILTKYNLSPLARIVSYATSGVDPSIMGTGPVPASKLALKKAGWTVNDLDLIEANEAFAAQAIYVNNEMKWAKDIVNICGGAIALGHPIGASGARILTTLCHNLTRLKLSKAIATMCIGGGMGIAICIEAVN